MLEIISPEAAAQVIGGHDGEGGASINIGVGCSGGVGAGCGVTVSGSYTVPIHLPKPKPATDWVAPGQRKQTDHANEIQGPTGKQRSK